MTVRQSPCNRPASRSSFMRGVTPPISTSLDMVYLPLGLRSASTGTFAPMRVKSSMLRSISAVLAMASRWRTALVDPPSAVTTVMAFSKDFLVRMLSGAMPFSSRDRTAFAAFAQSIFLASEMAAWAELFGRLSPRASIAQAMVLAVYMPPQEPGPGMAQLSMA